MGAIPGQGRRRCTVYFRGASDMDTFRRHHADAGMTMLGVVSGKKWRTMGSRILD